MTIRVVVAEDSPTARALLVTLLRSDPDVKIVGEAATGVDAVELTRQLRPDVVTMDIRMPQMDGFEATKRIMIETPTPIVIVTGSVHVREVEVSMNALRAGALAVLSKPPAPGSPGFEHDSRRLLDTVKAMSQVKVVRHWPERLRPSPAARKQEAGRIVALAASTGGPAAVSRVLADLPGDLPVPVLLVQHIAPGFVEGLASWLNTASRLRVKVAEQKERLKPGHVYLGPDDRHLILSDALTVHLSQEPPVGGLKPSATPLFESVAAHYGASAVAVILTGMGSDGVTGLKAIRKAGGRIIAQDEATSVVYGMPGAAAELADAILPVTVIGVRLQEWCSNGGTA